MLFHNAVAKIARFNQVSLHYNLVADGVYNHWRTSRAPFSPEYRSYLIAALMSFDMARMMGRGSVQRYDTGAGGFAARLDWKLSQLRPFVEPLMLRDLFEIDVAEYRQEIMRSYEILAARGQGGLHAQGKAFHVGATKILHFLNPELFMIVDMNTARALKAAFDIPYRAGTQPGYCSELYIQALSATKSAIKGYGIETLRLLEPETPTLRIFDKLAFVYGAGL